MWVEPAAVSRGEQQRWVGLRAMKSLKSSVCQVENTRESGVKFERAGWVFSRWREKQQKDFSCNFLWGRRAGVWGFRSLGFLGVFFEDVWRTFLEMFFTKQESVSAQILPAAERKCWPSGLSASSAALMKLLLLSVRSSGPEVFIFILVWSHAWIFPFFLFEVEFFYVLICRGVMAGRMEQKQDGYIRIISRAALDLSDIYRLFKCSFHYFLISSVLWNNSVAHLENRIRICSVHLWNLITFLPCGLTLWRRKIVGL